MNSQRAKRIMESITTVNVNYHGIPVFIQEVHPNEGMVTVFPLDEMDNEQLVELEGLSESKL